MDRALPIMPTMGAMAWPDNPSLTPDEGLHDMTMSTAQNNQMMDTTWAGPVQQPPRIPAGQMSPTSPGMDVAMDTSSAPTMANSTSSSCEESWGSGNAEPEEAEIDVHWEQGSDDILAVPKMEPVEDDFDFDGLKAAPAAPSAPAESSNAQTKQKRPRGRPRKHPLTLVANNNNKVTKGRSKTGCITCRKRKKKCDEAKPRCMNCEKNAVVCEGYHEKQIWKSGKEKAEEEGRVKNDNVPSITLPPLFLGVETIEDQIFWKHYVNNFSNVLTVEGEAKNAFKDIILHLANQHQGLMHSILSVSSRHIDYDAPYGAKLLQENPTTNRQALEARSVYHHEEAMKRLYEDNANSVDKSDPKYHTEEYQTTLAARYGQILCRLLQTRVEGNSTGEHRLHLKAYQTLMESCPPQDPTFYTFITEFFQYHIYADDMFWHPSTGVERLTTGFWEPDCPYPSPRLLGVADGLLHYMAIISCLRNNIRDNMAASIDPPVDYVMLFRAAEINNAIREWQPSWPPGDSRNRVGLLYKQMMFIYLFRTIYPPSSTPRSRSTCSGVSSMAPSSSSTPPRRASMTASVVSSSSAPVYGSSRLGGLGVPQSTPSSRAPSRTGSMHEGEHQGPRPAGSRGASPPPKRRPALDDPRLINALDESLNILESFNASEPSQTLLLIPCMMVGIACFDLDRRERVRKAVRAVRGYNGLRNCDRVSQLLEEIWALMDEGDWHAVWDWQAVARGIGIDVSCA